MYAPALLSLALGLWGVRRGGTMWRDEAVTYDMARRSLPDLWSTLADADAVHGLYYLLMHLLFEVTGGLDPLLVLRLPSVLATAGATGTLALLGHWLAGPRAGLLAGSVFALLPQVQRYAQEGRSYAIVCALVVWATYLLVRAVAGRDGRTWVAYAAVLVAAGLLHEFAVLALTAHAVAVPRAARRAWAGAAAVLVMVAPLAVLSTRQSDQVSWIGRPGAGTLAGFAGTAVVALVCAAICRNPTSHVLRGVRLPALALGLLVLPALLLLLVSLVTPLYVDRYVLYGQSGTALLTGAALDRLTRARRTRAAALTCAGAAVLALLPVTLQLRTPQSRVDDVGAIARAVAAAGAPGDGVLYLPARRRVWSLPDPGSLSGLRDLALDRAPAASHTLYGTEVAAPVVRARMLTATRIVAVSDPAGQPLDATPGEIVKRRVLATYFEKCGTRRVQGARVTVYARPGTC
ncbi:hypothetical protein [Streptomyces mirabilis]|uniref:hypothetical protein n=1 Tax=Streptomyces mirabilis TaxID=68239 RepID=UPI0036CCEE11